MNPIDTQQEHKAASSNDQETRSAGRGGFGLWLDRIRCRRTVVKWQRQQKKQQRRHRTSKRLKQVPYAAFIGNALYMIGFWTEYCSVCIFRKIRKICRAILSHAAELLLTILRPLLIGLITLCEDLAAPFIRIASGVRHIRELQQAFPEEDAQGLRKERIRYVTRGAKKYFPLVLNIIGYIVPALAAVVLVVTIRNGLDTRYILEVLVNGESVGYVANEQVFERARENVQSRINNAKTEMLSNGARVDDTGWAINPTYVLATEGEPMTENDMTDAILRASSDEISDATAVYIDGTLCYVTTEGDHLRSFLENIRAPYEDALDSTKRVEFLHNIELVDGVYFTPSIRSYDSIIASLREGAVPTVYIAEQGDTLETVLENTGLTFEELQQFNPQVEDETYQVTEGESLTVARGSSPLLQVKTIVRSSEQAEIAYERVQQESDQYSYGKLVTVQEGQNGLEERTYDTTYINGVATDQNLVQVVRLVEPVTEIVYKGTKISAGMYASTGSENWVWPVPQYSYVSRWMSSGHKGADICAPYGVDVIAADNGVVVTAGWHYSYGNYVVINHGNGWQTLYGHMSALYVSAGQAVQRGQAIGAIGSTGNSTGNHCHFEMYHNGALYSARNIFSGMG